MKCIICLSKDNAYEDRCYQCFIAETHEPYSSANLNWFIAPIPYTEIFEDAYLDTINTHADAARVQGYLMP